MNPHQRNLVFLARAQVVRRMDSRNKLLNSVTAMRTVYDVRARGLRLSDSPFEGSKLCGCLNQLSANRTRCSSNKFLLGRSIGRLGILTNFLPWKVLYAFDPRIDSLRITWYLLSMVRRPRSKRLCMSALRSKPF